MLRCGIAASAVLVSVLVLGTAWGEGTIKSGPQVGQEVPGPFHPLNVTGAAKGKKNCLYCANGPSPVALIFAREATPAVAKLLKRLDEATAQNKSKSMGSYAVFCSAQEGLETRLQELASKQGLETLVLSIDDPAGPKEYNLSKEADVTVLLYNDFTVRANHAYAKGQLTDGAIDRIVSDVSKIAK